MNARLLCPGPSLIRFDCAAAPPADFIVAVNRAALLFPPCDAWAALDWSMVEQYHTLVPFPLNGEPGQGPVLVTSSDTPRLIARSGLTWRGPSVLHKELADYLNQTHPLNYCLYSSTTGLVYAARRGATHIDVFGSDCEGSLDYDGVAAGTNRSPSRWESERKMWKDTTEALAERGVTVEMHRIAS